MRPLHIRRCIVLAVSAVLAAVPIAGCATDPGPTPAAGAAAGSTVEIANVDRPDPDAAEFFHRFHMGGLLEPEPCGSIAAGAAAASAVMIGRVERIEQTRTYQGEIADDRLSYVGVVLRPVLVLAGEVPDQFASALTVEFMTGSDPDAFDRLRKALPVGHEGLWFLRKKSDPIPGRGQPQFHPDEADYYRVMSSQGLFVQGAGGVVTPLAEDRPGDMAAEGRSYQRVSALVDAVRDLERARVKSGQPGPACYVSADPTAGR